MTLDDGKAHSVDSSDMAFQTAGALALKDAAEKGVVSLLEPVDEVAVLVADDYVGAVMSDLSTRRGRVLGSEPVGGGGRTMIMAEVPALEIDPLRHRPALALARHRHVQPALRPARTDALARRGEGHHRAEPDRTVRPDNRHVWCGFAGRSGGSGHREQPFQFGGDGGGERGGVGDGDRVGRDPVVHPRGRWTADHQRLARPSGATG